MSSSSNADNYCFQQLEIELKVAIQPLYSARPMDAVKQQLNNILYKFNESLDGVPLSFSELKLPAGKEYARIMADQFWLHVDVMTKLIIFKPIVGQKLCGKINKVSDNHISILILALFNASVSEEEMKKKYIYNRQLKSWQSQTGDLNEGDPVDLTVLSYQHANGVLHIDGRLE